MTAFRLQRILELKERREQVTAASLAEARSRAASAKATEIEIERVRRANAEAWSGVVGLSAGHHQNASFLLDRIDQRLAAARAAVLQAEAQVMERLAEFSQAARERHALDRLKERQADAGRVEAVERERRVMDAVAIACFVRRGMTTEDDGS